MHHACTQGPICHVELYYGTRDDPFLKPRTCLRQQKVMALAVDAAKATAVLRSVDDEMRRIKHQVRQGLAADMQRAFERRVAEVTHEHREKQKRASAADDERWRAAEERWQAREQALLQEQTRLAAERDEVVSRCTGASEEISQLAERQAAERESLLAMHAAAMEESARHNAELRGECLRLRAHTAALERELRVTEYETRLQSLEGEEALRAMETAVRELVPLRHEVLDHRAQAHEWSKAAAELAAAREADQVSAAHGAFTPRLGPATHPGLPLASSCLACRRSRRVAHSRTPDTKPRSGSSLGADRPVTRRTYTARRAS